MELMRHPAMIAVGSFFFRYRNMLFPVFVGLALLTCSPRLAFGDHTIDLWLDLVGAAIAIAGQGLRMLTIGYEYIVRGGRQGKVYAEDLVQGGVFAHSRNPLYLGNLLIIIGMAVMVHSLPLYLIGIPFFIFVYAAIIAAEENFLRGKFGSDYEAYCKRVNRIWPNWAGFGRSIEGMRFNWRRLAIREYGTVFGLALAIIGIRAFTLYQVLGEEAAPEIAGLLWCLVPVVVAYVGIRFLKKSGRLTEYRSPGIEAS
jgi:protein-S-isoprenylcysteine O-methyltransferase Ste14